MQEKRCLASHLCPDPASLFYHDRDGLCSKYAENFAYNNNTNKDSIVSFSSSSSPSSFYPSEEMREDYQQAFDKVLQQKKLQTYCRKVVHNLSFCMSPYIKYKEEVEAEGEGDKSRGRVGKVKP